jgi:hypothetical protein
VTPVKAPHFSPTVSIAWIRSAREAGGDSAVTVGLLIWRECRLGNTRRHHGMGTRPGFVKLTHKRVHAHIPMNVRTYANACQALERAGLVEIHMPTPNSARQFRVVAAPGEEAWTRRALGLPPLGDL